MSFSLDGVGSVLDNTTAAAANRSADSLKTTLSGDLSNATDEELMGACKEFEAYFVEQVIKEVEKTIPKNEDEDESMSQLTDYFKDEVVQKLASDVSEQSGLGIAQTMYEQMKRNYDL